MSRRYRYNRELFNRLRPCIIIIIVKSYCLPALLRRPICMVVKFGTWTIVICWKSQQHGTTVSDVFLNVEVLNHCNILPHAANTILLLHQRRRLLFWKKLYCSDSCCYKLESCRRMACIKLLSLWVVCNNPENLFRIHLPCPWTCDLRHIIYVFLMFCYTRTKTFRSVTAELLRRTTVAVIVLAP